VHSIEQHEAIDPEPTMNASNRLSRLISAALAVVCSLALLTLVAGPMNASRLAIEPHVVQFERVIVTAPAPASVAAVPSATATN
jgi:hypothetical protein